MDGDVDFLREALRVLLMDAEVSGSRERSPERVTYRNGYRQPSVGTMELHIP